MSRLFIGIYFHLYHYMNAKPDNPLNSRTFYIYLSYPHTLYVSLQRGPKNVCAEFYLSSNLPTFQSKFQVFSLFISYLSFIIHFCHYFNLRYSVYQLLVWFFTARSFQKWICDIVGDIIGSLFLVLSGLFHFNFLTFFERPFQILYILNLNI